MATALSHLQHQHHHSQQLQFLGTSSNISSSSAHSSPPPSSPLGDNFCKECGVMFESTTSLEVHLSYHRANLLSRWASQDPHTSNSTPPSTTNNNMETKFVPKSESQPSPQQQTQTSQMVQPSNLSPSPYYHQSHQIESPHVHAQYSMFPHYQDANIGDQNISSHFTSTHRQHIFSSDVGSLPPHHYDARHSNDLPPPPPPPPLPRDSHGKERSASTPEEILDLDSNKVHIYNFPHHQQLQYIHANNFYRPYLMTQPLPPPTNGNPLQHLHNLPPPPPPSSSFPQDSHHLSHIYRQNSPVPPRSPSNVPYEFIHGHPHQFPPPSLPHEHQSGPIAYGQPPPLPSGPITNFRGSFSSQQPMISSPIENRSPESHHHSPSLPPSGTEKQKTKKHKSNITRPDESSSPATPKTKGWKGGECKRPKTYNCIACNKWFTSSGHLKRHYGTTLHKNSLRQKGENPDDHPPQVSGKKSRQIQQALGKRSIPGEDCNGSGGDSNNGMDSSPSLRPTLITTTTPMSKSEESTTSKSTSHYSDESTRGITNFGQGHPHPPSTSSPYPNNSSTSQPPPTYLPLYHPPPNSSGSQQPPYGMPLGISHSQFHTAMSYDHPMSNSNVYTVSVPTSMYNGTYPSPMMNGEQLPPFSTVLSSYETQFSQNSNSMITPPLPNGPIYLHHGNLGPPPPPPPNSNSPLGLVSYDSESGIHSSNSTSDGNGHLNGESPEVARSVSTASGLEISDDGDILSDDGHHGSSSSTEFSSGSESELINRIESSSSEILQKTSDKEQQQQVIKCSNCSKTFNRSCYLTQHTNSSHTGGKPFKCPTCGKRFPEAPALSDHVAKHGNNKPYKCDLCPKQFNHKTDLRRHLCLHTGEKPFICLFCGKGFIRKDHMTKHSETHQKRGKGILTPL